MKFQILFCLLCMVNVGLACFGSASGGGKKPNGESDGGGDGTGGDKEPGAGNVGGGDGPAPDEKEPLDKMGIKAEDTNPYEQIPCNPDAGSDNKNFDCNDASGCQWGNAVEPEDQLDWRTSSKPPNAGQWKKNFASTTPPDGAYFVTAAKASPPEFTANLVTCAISCAQGDVLVGFGHWATENVKFEACKQAGPGTPLEACAPVTEREGPSIVQVAGGSNFNIVIRAMNFVDAAVGDVAVIDNLLLDYVACGTGPTTTPGGSDGTDGEADDANCKAMNCNFETDLCGGTDASELVTDPSSPFYGKVTKFEPKSGSVGNPVTGIPGPNPVDGGASYLVATMDESKRFAGLQFPHVPTTEKRVLVFDYFEATEGLHGRACFNHVTNDSCKFVQPDEDTKLEDRNWKTTQPIDIPPNTNVIYVASQNRAVEGDYQNGVFGIDNVRYLNPNKPGEGNLPFGSACTSPPHSLAARTSALQSRLRARRFSRHVINV